MVERSERDSLCDMNRLEAPPLAAATALLAFACVAPDSGPAAPSPAEELAHSMTGIFTSADQALEEPDDYFDIRLYMAPIWAEREDGPWLYVEQAAALALERPYRQRVYHLVDVPGGVRSDVFVLPGDPLDYAGAWARPQAFGSLSPGDLVERVGCSIHLHRTADGFEGSTVGTGCTSSLYGAAYATSQVYVTEGVLASWDRGFDAGGDQVWGAEHGPYLFVLQEDLPGPGTP